MNEPAIRTYRNARREMRFVVVLWFLAFSWTLGYCYLRGYQHPPDAWVVTSGLATPRTKENLKLVMGLPDWVAYGILAPWLTCSVITVWFGLYGMRDDDLGIDQEEGGAHG